jgi:hypothetical protein
MITIYKITSPSGRIYIGQSSNFKRRKTEYKRNKCKAQTLLYNSFIKYGFDSHVFEVVEETTKELADERETFWITHFNCFNTEHGLNLAPGGKRPAPKKGKYHYKAKPVYQWDFDGNFIKRWDCIRDIQNELQYISNVIGNSVKGKVSAYGYMWTFDNKSPGMYVEIKEGLKENRYINILLIIN